MTEICKFEDCTGCAACANVCAHSAIKMTADDLGFMHPEISQSLCVDCGVCYKTCPNNTTPDFHYPQQALAACSADPKEQLSSTSGGIASVISRQILSAGGVVYGCSGTDCADVRHIRIDREADIHLLKGSKYVQSYIGLVFRDIRRDLREGKKVLFVGTPCQVAGLVSSIPNKLREELWTLDFVCHGVPSQQMLTESLLCVDSRGIELNFRVKKWKSGNLGKCHIVTEENLDKCPVNSRYKTEYGLYAFKRGKEVLKESFPENNYIVGFLTGLLYRDSCYRCRYARAERVSDITLGDYHFDKTDSQHIEGENRIISKVIINTERGAKLIEDVKPDINSTAIKYESLLKGNSQLMRPMRPHPLRDKFLAEFRLHGMAAASKILAKDKLRIRYHLFINRMRDLLYSNSMLRNIIMHLKR
ncbi:MAG: 4Fe-4S dicluster domain-containing protein [Bacteroidales bacterium]|nr:4Fe-4S dicluster domain-containing protein [Bacteroidales bacterium]